MRGLLIELMECSVTMSVLAFCFIALTPWLSKRYSAKWLYYCWLVIVIGLIIPFRFHSDTPLIHNDLFANTVAVQQTAFDKSDMWRQHQTGAQSKITGGSGTVSDGQETASGIIRQLLHSPWYLCAGVLWIFGAVIFITFHGVRHRRFLQMVRRWSQEVSDQQTMDILQDQKLGLGISKRVELRTCACIASPMMIGLIKSVILLPKAEYSEAELSLVFRHELIHFKRKDLWYKALAFFSTAIHWFNPVIYLMAKAIAVQCEISCDMEVVKGTDLDRRQQYSETILNVVRNNTGMRTAFSTNFYGGKKEMKNRIFSIMDSTKKKTGIFILCTVLILALGSGVVFAAGADNPEDTNQYTVEVHNDTTKLNFTNEPSTPNIETAVKTLIPLIGGSAAKVGNVTTSTSSPYVAVSVGALPSGMSSVNIRVHDNTYNADDTSHDDLQMYSKKYVAITFQDTNKIIAGHTYTIYMSANGSSGYVYDIGCSAVAN